MLLAAALGFLWVGVALWQMDTFEEPVRVPLTNVSGVAGAGPAGKDKAGGLRVNVGLLASAQSQREATFTTPRNIFAVPREDGTLSVGNEAVQAADNAPEAQEAVAQQALAAVLEQYRYLGFLRMGENRPNREMAVLSKDDEVVVVKVGDHVEDHLVLKAIAQDSVTIRDTGARVEHTLLLTEDPSQQP
jgi:hypothetical protein